MLQHQIVQSPARLGLTNPNSPSLPIQQQQQQQTHQTTLSSPSSSSANATTSSNSQSPSPSNVLLPLLPPLRRAQSLLAQMASLTARLFDLSPNRSAWLSSFRGAFPSFLPSATPLSSTSGPASVKEALSQFAALQTQLFESVAQLQEILDLQDSRAKLAREVRAKDAAALAFTARIKDAEQLLDALLDDYSHYRKPENPDANQNDNDNDDDDEEGDSGPNTTMVSRLNLPDILSYAHKISYTTFAPPEFGAGSAPLRGALPPAPQDEQMRASQLYAFAGLDVGLPISEPEPDSGPSLVVEAPAPAAVLPANITVPAGWKPGMPVELPINIPLPPPGWKPGDPVPLPAIPAPAVAVQPVLPPRMAVRPAGGETIHVRPVQLDILDQDDDTSDYSSDEASSSDDD